MPETQHFKYPSNSIYREDGRYHVRPSLAEWGREIVNRIILEQTGLKPEEIMPDKFALYRRCETRVSVLIYDGKELGGIEEGFDNDLYFTPSDAHLTHK